MKKIIILFVLLSLAVTVSGASAAQLRVFVADMNAIGAVQNRDEMKLTLQSLLASRLNSDKIVSVASAAEADAIVSGTFVSIGKVFSIDALAKASNGKTLTRAFVQSENQDELIAAVGKLAEKLSTELQKIYFSPQTAGAAPALSPALGVPVVAPSSDFIRGNADNRPGAAGDFIKPREFEKYTATGWLSKRLEGAANLIALGKALPEETREIFLAEDRHLTYYRQGKEMKKIAETSFKVMQKIISLDTIENGSEIDIYVTIIQNDEPVSQVWQVKGDKLVMVAENLPYFFRAFNPGGGPKKLFAQSMGRSDSDYYDDVFEAQRNGSKIILKNPVKMPRFGNIYTYNQFKDKDGIAFTVVINSDNYLIVFDAEHNELWRSNDRFGGSELYYQRDDSANMRTTGDKFRWIFMTQRIQVTSKGDILIAKNDGFWVLGNARSYKRGSVYNLIWNGSSLEEKWHTRDTQNYMPDYFYDEARNELLVLQIVQRPGFENSKGASSLSIRKVE